MQTTDIIRAAPSPLAKAFWGRYFERMVRKHFHTVNVRGLEHLEPWSVRTLSNGSAGSRRMKEPLILYATHNSWWDAALTIILSLRQLHLDAYGMMEYKQLDRYRFFRSIGMFSVVREDPRNALTSLRYAADLLRGTGRALWMFPQGELVQQDHRPLHFSPGIGILANMVGTAWFCPVVLRYELVREQRPDAWVTFGTPERHVWGEGATAAGVTSLYRTRLTEEADAVRTDVLNILASASGSVPAAGSEFMTLYQGGLSIEKRLDRMKGRVSSTE